MQNSLACKPAVFRYRPVW